MARLQDRLERLAEIEEPARSIEGAIAAVREAVGELRAWSAASADSKPWRQDGGRIHLTDVLHAGATGRPRIFVLGLDAERTAGPRRQDPLLVDADRLRVAEADLPPVAERVAERRYSLAAALAGLRGKVTFSYAFLTEQGESEVGPSALLLQVYRVFSRDASKSYEDLRGALGPAAGAVPRQSPSLDTRDVWLGALASDGLLRDGTAVLAERYPQIGAGIAAAQAREGDILTVFHGTMPGIAGRFAPDRWDRPFSPSGLETLAACPLRWFYRYGLEARLPEDPEYDPERWLDPLARGALLHRVYERFAREYLVPPGRRAGTGRGGADPADRRGGDRARPRRGAATQHDGLHRRGGRAPAGRAVIPRDAAGARRRCAVDRDGVCLRRPGRPRGYPLGCRAPVDPRAGGPGRSPGGRFLLRVIDYKTGRSDWYSRDYQAGPFRGGRRLQPAIYAVAAEELMQARVARSEYWFPTQQGTEPVGGIRSQSNWKRPGPVVESLVSHLREGNFVPPTTRTTASSATSSRSAARRWTSGITSPRPSRSGPPSMASCCRPLGRCGAGERADERVAPAGGSCRGPARPARPGPHRPRPRHQPAGRGGRRIGQDHLARGPDAGAGGTGDPGGAPRRRDLHPEGCRRTAGAFPGRTRSAADRRETAGTIRPHFSASTARSGTSTVRSSARSTPSAPASSGNIRSRPASTRPSRS